MKKNVIQIYDQPNQKNKSQASWIGFACGLMSYSKIHSKYEILYLRKIVEPWKGLAKTDTMNLVFSQKHEDRNVWNPQASIHT